MTLRRRFCRPAFAIIAYREFQCNSRDMEEQALEVSAFGVEEGDGVVGGLDVAGADDGFPFGFDRRLEEELAEEVLIDEVGAGAT